MNKIRIQEMSHFTLVIILAAVSYFLLMFGNNRMSLTHPDEVFYTQTAVEMVDHNSWLTPILFNYPQFEKPIMFFIMLASAVKIFGPTPAAARFWPGLFGIIGVLVTYWISWMLFDRKRTAFLSGLILGSSFIYLALSRAVLTDVVFSVFIAISIGFFFMAYKYEEKRTSGTILFFIFSAIAVLTKGILGMTFTFTTGLLFLAYSRDLRLLKNKAVWVGFALFLLIALPWHVLMYMKYGNMFIDEYFRNVHIRRLFDSEHPKINKWFFYPALMLAGVIPWIFVSVPAWWSAIKKFIKKDVFRNRYFFLLAWIFSVLLYTQPAASKLASYILPLFPAIAIMIGAYLDERFEAVENGRKTLSLPVCGHIASLVLLGVSAAAIIVGRKHLDILISMKPMYVLSVVTILISAFIFSFNIKREYSKMIYAHLAVTAALLFSLIFAIPYAEPWVSCKDISEKFNQMYTGNGTVLASKFYVRGIRFYTKRDMAVIAMRDEGFFSPHPIPFLNDDAKLLDFFKTQKETYAVVKDEDIEEIKRVLRGRPYTVEQFDGMGGKHILRIKKIEPLKQY